MVVYQAQGEVHKLLDQKLSEQNLDVLEIQNQVHAIFQRYLKRFENFGEHHPTIEELRSNEEYFVRLVEKKFKNNIPPKGDNPGSNFDPLGHQKV